MGSTDNITVMIIPLQSQKATTKKPKKKLTRSRSSSSKTTISESSPRNPSESSNSVVNKIRKKTSTETEYLFEQDVFTIKNQ